MSTLHNSLPALAALFFVLVLFTFAQAQENTVVFPVAELGSCGSKQECKAYCDEPGHFKACFSFARAHGLLPEEDKNHSEEEVEKFAQIMQKGGPGGCTTPDSCRTYCESAGNMKECIAFGKEHGLMKAEELEEAEKVLTVLERGGKLPGGCTSKESCEAVCADPSNAEECTAFALEAGFIKPEEAGVARKAMELMGRGETPGGCRGPRQCEAYCSDSSRAEECEAFAKKLGIEPPRGRGDLRVSGPGGCSTPGECSAYCEARPEECRGFGGFNREGGEIRSDEFGRSGPPTHFPEAAIACLKERTDEQQVAKVLRNERPSPETEAFLRECLSSIRSNDAEIQGRSGHQFPEQVLSCIRERVSSDVFEKVARGGEPDSETEGLLRSCFESLRPSEGAPQGGEGRPHETFSESRPPEGFSEGRFVRPEGFVPPKEFRPDGAQGIPPSDFRPLEGFSPPPEFRSGEGFTAPTEFTRPLPPAEAGALPPTQSVEQLSPVDVSEPSSDAPRSFLEGAESLLGAVISAFRLK